MMNQSFHVLNEALEPRPLWVPGQLYIGGTGLAKGYWRDEERTRANFLPSFIPEPESGYTRREISAAIFLTATSSS